MLKQEHTVLLVDDEPNVTAGLSRQLRREPYRILTASSGSEALQILEREKIDLIITDERMPHMTGAELVSKVRKKYPEIICMMLSGQADFEAAIRAINEGEIYRFLKKPCDPLDIATDIRLALEQQGLALQSRKLLDQYRKKITLVQELQKAHPKLFEVEYNEDDCVVIGDNAQSSSDPLKKVAEDIKNELTQVPKDLKRTRDK